MRRLLWVPVMIGMCFAVGCQLPRGADIQPARTNATALEFERAVDGVMDAKAALQVYNLNPMRLTVIEVEANLYAGTEKVGVARFDKPRRRVGSMETVYIDLKFKDVRVADLEKGLGRPLAQQGIADFEIDGAITYKTQEGALTQPFPKSAIKAFLGPRGSRT
jgi:hypothetical protein